MKVTLIGTGYVGLVAGTCFAETGNEVVCLDINPHKIDKLKAGELPIYEPGLSDLLLRNIREQRLRFTTSYAEAIPHGDIFFLCLPTPPDEDGSADLRHVLAAMREATEYLKQRDSARPQPLFVMKSTVPVGTNAKVRALIASEFKGSFAVASNPEFLKEGTAVEDFLKPDRVVIGANEDSSFERLQTLYEPFCRTGAPILRMDPASAEITKYGANGMLAVKISFMNEMARLCDAYGADVEQVRKGISLDPRIGKHFLFPGVGYGGSCFPKDTRALVVSGKLKGIPMEIVDAAERVNEAQKLYLLPRMEKVMDGLHGKKIAIWGLAFKPRTDDIREAPALAIIEQILQKGAAVSAFDPEAMNNARGVLGNKIEFGSNLYDILHQADALVLVTEWNEFRSPDWEKVRTLMRSHFVFDGRNIYKPESVRQAGFFYMGLGRV